MINIWKPWYVYNPRQIAHRLMRSLRPPADPIQTVAMPWGCKVQININETIGRSIWTTGVYDLAVSEVLYRLACRDLLSIDAGANIGVITGLLAARSAEVWAFEPNPLVYERLQKNIEFLKSGGHFSPCIAHRIALSKVAGKMGFELPDCFDKNQGTGRISDSATGTIVQAGCLDHILGSRQVGVMKVDVEGHELELLQGASVSLERGQITNIVFEDHEGCNSSVMTFLQDKNFSIFSLGWKMNGPILSQSNQPAHRDYEAPSYLATLHPDEAMNACAIRGWQCLSSSCWKAKLSK